MQERGWIPLKNEMGRVRFCLYPSGTKSRILKTFDGLRVLCLHNDPQFLQWRVKMACHCSHFPDEHLQLHCSSAIIWVLDKTAWSTLVTLEIRIREISWQAIWEQSNQVSKNSVGRPRKENEIVLSVLLCSCLPDGWPIATPDVLRIHLNSKQNGIQKTKSLSHSEECTARWCREYGDNCNQDGASFHYVLRYRP